MSLGPDAPVPTPPAAPAVWFPTIVTGTGTQRFTERLAAGLTKLGIRTGITWLPLRAEYAPWSVSKPVPPDWANVIHVNSTFPPSLLPPELPWVATIHSGMHDPRLLPFKTITQRAYHALILKPRERSLLHRAQRITAVSSYARQMASQVFEIPQVTTVFNGVDTTVFTPRGKDRAPGLLRLLYVGRWSRRKGTDLIKPLLQQLAGRVDFLFTATADEAARLGKLPGVSRCVGRLENDAALAALYRSADVLLFPSRSEGFGLVAVEAMACGLPVICVDDTALKEIVPQGECGFRCVAGDPDEFAKACLALAAEPQLLERMSQAAREHAANEFGIPAMVETYLTVYRDALCDQHARWRAQS